MGEERKIESPGSMVPAYCHVAGCEWERFVETENMGKFLAVLHVIVKHPDAYYEATGKNPFTWQRIYGEEIKAVRRWL